MIRRVTMIISLVLIEQRLKVTLLHKSKTRLHMSRKSLDSDKCYLIKLILKFKIIYIVIFIINRLVDVDYLVLQHRFVQFRHRFDRTIKFKLTKTRNVIS